MKKQLLALMAFSAACLVLGAQGQTSPGSPGTSPGSPGSTPGSPGSSPSTSPSSGSQGYDQRRLSATGRMGQQELRGSKLMSADVKGSSGETLGKIEDVLINSMSGRIDFAVLSYQGSGSSSSSSTSPSTTTSPSSTTSASSTSSSSGGKLVPVPWSYLRASGMGGTGATAGSSEQVSFVFAGDKSKLDNAPSFDQSNWPDVTQPEWRQRIFSHFGMQPGSSTGGATSPGGVGTSTSSPDSSQPGSPRSGTTPQR
jgi:sporulation protein YlmC with PRC-barrel domain